MPRVLKVLQVVPYYLPAWGFGGPPRVMFEEARELTRRGHHVEVFTTDVYESHIRVGKASAVEDGVHVRRFKNVSNRLAHSHTRFSPIGLRAALRQVTCDVVHLSELRHELALLTSRATRRGQLPLVVSAHGTLPTGRGLKGRVKEAYDHMWVHPMLSRAEALLAQTEHEAIGYSQAGLPADRIHLLPLGTGVPPRGEPSDLSLEPDRRVVLFLGRIDVLKGVDRLIRALARLGPRHKDVVLAIVGRDQGAEPSLRRLAGEIGVGDRVRFLGPIYGDARFAAYRRADLFALTPRFFEETSLASIEAASVGTPLLLGEESEAPFLAEYGAGWSVPAGTDVAPILDAALSADLRAAGECAERMVKEKHLWSVVGRELERILLGVVG